MLAFEQRHERGGTGLSMSVMRADADHTRHGFDEVGADEPFMSEWFAVHEP